ncbi:MAG: hypothetical protein U0174_09505 [Polyangiaceae bacterium]
MTPFTSRTSRALLACATACFFLGCASDGPGAEAPKPTCKEQEGTVEVGKLGDPDLKEASGLAPSFTQSDLLWSHNDSGDEARVFALGKNGRARGQVHFDGVSAVDIEDIAVGREGTRTYIYAADIGDNLTARTELFIYRIEEPRVPDAPIDLHVAADVMTFTYEGGTPHDAETLLVDPRTLELFIVTKERARGQLYRLGPFVKGTGSAKLMKDVPVDTATGGSFSPDGKSVVIRDYSGTAKLWSVGASQSLADALSSTPCPVALGLDLQGEAICFDSDSRRIFTTSEGKFAPLHRTDPAP